MPWKSWIDNIALIRPPAVYPAMPLTLITLLGRPHVSREEFAFYAAAEHAALSDWAEAGWLVLAFPALDRDEMTLVCTEPLAEMRERVCTLPLVAADLVTADLRTVVSIRLTAGAMAGQQGGFA